MGRINTQKMAARQFVKDWSGKGYEKGETQRFWLSLLHNVYGIDDPTKIMEFETPVKTFAKDKGKDFIDAYIIPTRVLIEQKGSHIDLKEKATQSDRTELTPFQQGLRYASGLGVDKYPRWIVACNFQTFEVHDMTHPEDEPQIIHLKDLAKEYHRLTFLIDDKNAHVNKELEVSRQASVIIGIIYDKLLAQYKDPNNPESQKALNKLCVRLVFCLYAEDAGIFGAKNMFHDYMNRFSSDEFRKKLIDLFRILDTKPENRDPYEDEALLAFPYVNGGMFSGDIEIPRITDEIRSLILQRASDDFDWSLISPTIFGAMFESTLNPETRRAGGMHYTSIENIHKVIDPLFLNQLKDEFEQIKSIKIDKIRKQRAQDFQNKLSKLTFLDPACGSGNFLTESYTSLRRLENETLKIIYGRDRFLGDLINPIKVTISQFYGIEINDFACSVAQTALWIAESQMMRETEEIVGFNLDPLPLKRYTNIKEGNALRLDWTEWDIYDDTPTVIAQHTNIYPSYDERPALVSEPESRYSTVDLYSKRIEFHNEPKTPLTHSVRFDYIMGNPPFIGYALQNPEQKQDMLSTLIDEKGKTYKAAGKVDYVAAWYFKTAALMQQCKSIKAAFVSTNSITQGEQVALVWKPLKQRYGINFDFAWRTFVWDNEVSQKAQVHCVIIGFSLEVNYSPVIFNPDGTSVRVNHINPYLIDADDVFIEARHKPIANVSEMSSGGKPVEGGFLIFTEEEKDSFLRDEPDAAPLFKRLLGAKDFINGGRRYCLWLVNVNPTSIRKLPKVLDRVEKVRNYRLRSSKDATRRSAETPTLFQEVKYSATDYIAVPEVSSSRRLYVPMDFIDSNVICTNAMRFVPDASLYEFGVMTSIVHNAWMRVVCGRMKSDYDYSNTVVYNNFPWPKTNDTQKDKISQTAKSILEARNLYPESSLADLYDELSMPIEVRKAHRANDMAVLEAYGFPKDSSESEIVSHLFKMYQELTNK